MQASAPVTSGCPQTHTDVCTALTVTVTVTVTVIVVTVIEVTVIVVTVILVIVIVTVVTVTVSAQQFSFVLPINCQGKCIKGFKSIPDKKNINFFYEICSE